MFESPEQEQDLRANLDRYLMPLAGEHAELVLQWRNRADVRENMYTTHEISPTEHAAWLERLKCDSTRRYFVFHVDGRPCGVVGFTEISAARDTASWAFYAGTTKIKGLGSTMERCALLYAFERLHLRRLSCEVLSHNMRVVEMHRRFGFLLEGIRRSQHMRPDRELDIYLLALSATHWRTACATPFPGAIYRETWLDEVTATSIDPAEAFPATRIQRGLGSGAARHVASRESVLRPVAVGDALGATSRVLTKIGAFSVVQSVIVCSDNVVAIVERDYDDTAGHEPA